MRNSNILKSILLLFLFCTFLCGCTRVDMFEKATELYAEGRYEEAEPFFLKAMVQNPDSELIHIGYGYNLLCMGKEVEAAEIFEPLFNEYSYGGGYEDTAYALGLVMLDIYLRRDEIKKASEVCDRMVSIAPMDKVNEYAIESASLRRMLYENDPDSIEQWEKALRDLIAYKSYAGEEYNMLFESYRSREMKKEQLELADEILVYMRAHTSYIKDFGSLIGAMFTASTLAEPMEWSHNQEYYLSAMEEFVAIAETEGDFDPEVFKYKIIIAEYRGKLKLAYQLLGVYLNHCPDDKKAIKEQLYLKNRLNITE